MCKISICRVFSFLLISNSVLAQKNIIASGSLLINTSENNTNNSLRVKGTARIDSMLLVRAGSESRGYISIGNNVKNSELGEDDLLSPYTSTPTEWAANNNIDIPIFQLRHPNNTINSPHPNTSVQRDFKILPYQYGMAIEYNGVVECWVGEWSIHRGINYYDIEGRGNGWGAVSWVGDDQDGGGIRMTARNNLFVGGNVNYGELSVEKFAGEPNGDLRLRLPSKQNNFHFLFGTRGTDSITAKIKNDGLVIPKVLAATAVQKPEAAQIVFDSTDKEFKGYNGTEWVSLDFGKVGCYTASSNGIDTVFTIPHGLGSVPLYFNVLPTSLSAAGLTYVTADSNFLYINYAIAPLSGNNTLTWNWAVKNK